MVSDAKKKRQQAKKAKAVPAKVSFTAAVLSERLPLSKRQASFAKPLCVFRTG